MDVQLDQLRALAAVVAEGTFDGAARSLQITPSAVSQRIKALESAAGRVLVERSKPVRPTDSGQTVLRLAREVELLFADAAAALGGSAGAGPTPLPIVVNADSLTTWVLPALAPLADRISFRLHSDDQDHSIDLLRDGSVMGAVTSSDLPVQGCSVRRLGRMRYHAMATPEFVTRWLPEGLTRQAMSVAPVVVFDLKDDLQDQYLAKRFPAAADQGGLRPPRHLVPASADFATAVELGMGWAMLPDIQVRRQIGDGRLVVLDRRPVDVPLYWQQWKSRSPLLDEVADVLVAAASRALVG